MENEDLFVKYCSTGDFKKVKEMALNNNNYVLYNDCAGFFNACMDGHLKIVIFLLRNKKLKIHANMYARDGLCIYWANYNKNYDVVNFLLYKMNFEYIKLVSKKQDKNTDELIKKFAVRDLEKKININLINKDMNDRINKI